jgi:acetyltransferase-like isoleucine patch superfamily enzyme
MIKTINQVGINANDIKVLGKVVSISTDTSNGNNGLLAEALQVWDSGFNQFNYNGANQNVINDLLGNKLQLIDAAGLIPQNGSLNITIPTTFNDNITLGSGVTIGPDVHVTGNATVDHTITGNTITSQGALNGATLNVTGAATVGGAATVNGKFTANGGSDLHGATKIFDSLTVDGDTTVNNFTVNGTFNAPHATTTRYGITRLATGLNSNADDDVVPVSMFRTYFQQLLNNPNTVAIDSIAELLDKINANEALVPSKLNDLSDVNSSNTPSTGDVLYYNGTAWVNIPFQTLFDNAIASYLTTLNNNIAGASLWQVRGNYLIPKDTTKNVATTTGRIYSGITL